jgi:ketosteroid isomerase-like protein
VADHPNVELLQRGYAAYSSGDMETINEVFADDIVWHIGGRSDLAGDYNGKDEVFGFFAKLMERSEGTNRIEVHDVLANDEHGAVLVTETATRGEHEFSGRSVHTFHLHDGKVTEFWDAPLDQYATDEFYA